MKHMLQCLCLGRCARSALDTDFLWGCKTDVNVIVSIKKFLQHNAKDTLVIPSLKWQKGFNCEVVTFQKIEMEKKNNMLKHLKCFIKNVFKRASVYQRVRRSIHSTIKPVQTQLRNTLIFQVTVLYNSFVEWNNAYNYIYISFTTPLQSFYIQTTICAVVVIF